MQWVRRDPLLVALLLLASVFFWLYYITDPSRPVDVFSVFSSFRNTTQYPLGWFGFYDQGQYLQMAEALANFSYSGLQATYSYGLGYPLVAVPALWLGFDKDPFVFFNFGVFVFATYAVYRTAKQLISPFAGFLAGFGIVFATPLITYTSQPWNSTVCLLAISGILLTVTVKKVTLWHALTVGFLVGWSFAARYVDVAWLLPLALASLYRGSFKNVIKLSIFVGIGVTIWLVPVLYSHYKFFGSPFRTPYVNHVGLTDSSSDQQLNAYSLVRIPDAALGMFISPRLAGSVDNDRGFLISMFWVVAAIPGAIIVLRQRSRRLFWGTLVVVTVLAFIFYLSFRASTPYSLKYGILHYFKMFWPGLIILAVVFFDKLFQRTLYYAEGTNKKRPKKAS